MILTLSQVAGAPFALAC